MGKSKSSGGSSSVKAAANKASSDGKITAAEAKKVVSLANQSGANPALAIAQAAAKNQAQIVSEVQRSLSLTQNKQGISYTPNPAAGGLGYGFGGSLGAFNTAVKPGVAPITGYRSYSVSNGDSGSTNMQSPVYTFFNGMQQPGAKSQAGKAAAAQQAASAQQASSSITDQQPMKPMTDQWGESVDDGMAALQDMIRQQMEANAAQQSQYMSMMQDMMGQMQNAMTPQATPQGAYATTSYQVAPAMGATQTSEINRRKPLANDSLTISDAPTSAAAGAGLNLAI